MPLVEAVDWIVGGVLGFTGLAFSAGCTAFSKAAHDIECAEEVLPGSELFDRMQEEQCLPYAAVSGYVQPKRESSRSLTYGPSDAPCVVKVTTTREHAKEYSRSSRSWHNSTKTVSSTFQSIPFGITSSAALESGHESHSVTVTAGEGDFSSVLTKAESSFESAGSGVGQSLLGLFSGHRVTGYEHVEKVLPVAEFITIIGKISLVGKSIVVEAPTKYRFVITTDSLEELASQYYSRSRLLGFFAAMCFTGLGIFALFRLHRHYEKWLRAKEAKNLLSQLSPPGDDETNGPVSDTCCVCLNNRSTILIMDCRHLCVCPECSVQVEDCPICRGAIADRVPTFRS